MTYLVKSIFGPTIQGEGSTVGTVVKFLRLSACNRWSGLEADREKSICFFCDTDFRGGERLTSKQIVDQLNKLGPCRTVVISGGEPMLQINKELLAALRDAGYSIHLETNGSIPVGDLVGFFQHISISPKQGPTETKIEVATDIKILVPFIADNIDVKSFENFPARNKFVQPIAGSKLETAMEIAQANPGWKLSLQVHKFIGVE